MAKSVQTGINEEKSVDIEKAGVHVFDFCRVHFCQVTDVSVQSHIIFVVIFRTETVVHPVVPGFLRVVTKKY